MVVQRSLDVRFATLGLMADKRAVVLMVSWPRSAWEEMLEIRETDLPRMRAVFADRPTQNLPSSHLPNLPFAP